MSGLPRSSHALVTGGGRGIGREIAATLARAGATVTVLGRNRATLDDAIASGAAHFAGVADVADQAAVSAAIAEAAARQPIDMLIANAGIAESAPFGKSDAALFRRMMDVNFMGVVHTIQAALPSMRERSYGRIVAIGSLTAVEPHASLGAYVTFKSALATLVRTVALENKDAGLTANLILPGTMDTPANRKAMPAADPLKWVQPGAVADVALLLTEDRAAQVTGTVIPIDGTNV